MDEKVFLELKNFLSDLLGIDGEQISREASLFQLGIDSVMMMTIVKEINDLFKVDLSLSDITFKYNTFQRICDYIAEANQVQEKNIEKLIVEENSRDAIEQYVEYDQNKVEQKGKKSIECYVVNENNENVYQYFNDIFREQKETLERIFTKQLDVLQGIQIANTLVKTNEDKQDFSVISVTPATENSQIKITSEKDENYKIESASDSNISIDNKITLTKKQNKMLQQLIDSLVKKTSKSKQLAAEYRKNLADLDEVAGFSILLKEIHYQISMELGNGSKMIDVDGNQYVDIAMGFGSLILGYSPKIIMDALQEEFSRGIQIAPRHRLVGEVAKLVCELTGFDRATFTVTGTEAVMTSMKFARAYSKKEKIGVFTGCYHGHSDATLITKMSKNDLGRPLAPGISKSALDDMILFDYNNMTSIEELRRHKDELAAVIIEPVQSRRPEVQPVDFLKAVRKVTKENGILLIFDEVITGFRCNIGGAKRYFGIEPDMATYGKAACNGMPIGIVAGKAEIMDVADGGIWEYGDDSYPMVEQTFYAGTFFKHPFTMGAAYAILKFYKEDNNALQSRLAENTSNLVSRLNEVFKKYKVPIEVNNFTSLFKFKALSEKAYIDIFYYKLLDYGIFTWEGRTCFLSDAHTDEDVDKIVDATTKVVQDMVDAGFYGQVDDGFKQGLPNELFYD